MNKRLNIVAMLVVLCGCNTPVDPRLKGTFVVDSKTTSDYMISCYPGCDARATNVLRRAFTNDHTVTWFRSHYRFVRPRPETGFAPHVIDVKYKVLEQADAYTVIRDFSAGEVEDVRLEFTEDGYWRIPPKTKARWRYTRQNPTMASTATNQSAPLRVTD